MEKREKLYVCWCHIKARCNNPNSKDYKYYGGKGIKMCEEWSQDYLSFKQWALDSGYQEGLEIDRIKNDKDYCPENCRWRTRKEQMNNTTHNHLLTYNGETKTMAQWADEFDMPYGMLKQRINKCQWSVEKALTTPTRKTMSKDKLGEGIKKVGRKHFLTYQGVTKTVAQWEKDLGLYTDKIARYVRKGYSAKDCIELSLKE